MGVGVFPILDENRLRERTPEPLRKSDPGLDQMLLGSVTDK